MERDRGADDGERVRAREMNGRIFKVVVALLLGLAEQLAHAGTVTYVYTDPQGTPLAEADASGNITATFDYKPYGSQVLGNPKAGPGYTGHVNDPDTGFVYMQARYYDSAVGRFLSIDPVSPRDGRFARYNYASSNPVNRVDPDGRYDFIFGKCANNPNCYGSGGGQASGPSNVGSSRKIIQKGYVEDSRVAEFATADANRALKSALGRNYDSPEDAVRAWVKIVEPISLEWRTEIASKLFDVGAGKIRFSAAVSSGVICSPGTQCFVSVNVAPNLGGVCRGYVHTHPDYYGLSPNDIGMLYNLWTRSGGLAPAAAYASDPSGGIMVFRSEHFSPPINGARDWSPYQRYQERIDP